MQKEVWQEHVMQDGGVIPATRSPCVDGKATRNAQGTTRTRCKHEHLIHHMHSFTDGRLGVIPSKRAFPDGSGSMLAEVVVPGSEGDLTNPSPSGFFAKSLSD